MTGFRGARILARFDDEWTDLSRHFMTEWDIQVAEARFIITEWLRERR